MCEEESAGRKAAGSSCVPALLLEEQHYSIWAGMGGLCGSSLSKYGFFHEGSSWSSQFVRSWF